MFEYLKIRNIKSINKLKVTILNFISPKGNSVFYIPDTNGIKFLTRLRLNFSQLYEHKFRHNFNNTVDPMCICGRELETTLPYLLHFNLYSAQRLELLNPIQDGRGGKKPPYQCFPCNFYKRRNYPPKFSDF